ncbi:MAG TPA: 30S ribosomal protein S4, partial [bacterium]|nr:30S ribosomal protein S4 [bacterium]
GRRVDIPSYRVKSGDIIKVKASQQRNKIFNGLGEKLLKKNFQAPGWLFLEVADLEVKVLHEPKPEDLEKNINTQMIVEFYAR